MSDPRIEEAKMLMNGFLERTGLTSDAPPRRYLWTDAFAVCNLLGLARATGDQEYRNLAQRLVLQVHSTLGRHREEDPGRGWISGLGEEEGEAHPTRGGLRIGKELPERNADEPFDEQLEWERDGQYFHYLTKWMHALDQMSRATGKPLFNLWARELAVAAQKAFIYYPSPGRPPRMYWKMSVDLRRPLVPSMGQHDPLDGYVTAAQLETTAAVQFASTAGSDLKQALRSYAAMIDETELASADPLGIGGLLIDAYRLQQLMIRAGLAQEPLLGQLLTAADRGLQHYLRRGEWRAPAEYRLAFRELGLAIGLKALESMAQEAAANSVAATARVRAQLATLMRYLPLGEEIESYWRNPEHQLSNSWHEHRDINEVMLTTRLAPEGFLIIGPGD